MWYDVILCHVFRCGVMLFYVMYCDVMRCHAIHRNPTEHTLYRPVRCHAPFQSNVEIKIERVHAVSRAAVFLPFSVEDASRSDAEVEASQVRKVVRHRIWYDVVENRTV